MSDAKYFIIELLFYFTLFLLKILFVWSNPRSYFSCFVCFGFEKGSDGLVLSLCCQMLLGNGTFDDCSVLVYE